MKIPASSFKAIPLFMWFLAALFYGYEFFQRVAPSIMATPIMQAFHLPHSTFAAINALYLYAYAFAQLPAGILLDRYGPRICLALSALLVAIGTLLFSETLSLFFLGVGRIFVGIGSAFAFIGCLKLATQWFTTRSFGFIVGLTNFIGVLGALVGQAPLALLVEHLGWVNSLFYSGLTGLFIALILGLFLRSGPRKEATTAAPPPFFQSIKILLKTPQNWILGFYAGLMVSPVIAFTELWAIPFLEQVHHFNAVTAASVNQLIFVGIAIGGPTHGLMTSRWQNKKAWMGAFQSLAILTLLAIIWLPLSKFALMAFMLIFGFSISSMLLSFPLATELHPKAFSGIAIAWTNLFIMLIGAGFQNFIGQALTFVLSNHAPSGWIFQSVLTSLPIALVLNFLFWCFIRPIPPNSDPCHYAKDCF